MLPICATRLAVPFALTAALAAATQSPPAVPPAAPTPAAVPQDAGKPTPTEPRFVRLRFPKDQDFVVAEVDGAPLSLGQLVQHIDQRHYPGFRDFAARDSGQLLFASDLIAPWVRQFADITALMAEAKSRQLELKPLDALLAERLRGSFQGYLDNYVAEQQKLGNSGKLEQQRVDRLLADYQLRHGLGCELAGWLDFLEPANYTKVQLRDYFTDHARIFGGLVTIQHILIPHRDAGTGILFGEAGRAQALARMADVKSRLRPDGSNFAEVARLCSADTKTAANGGELANVARFDDRLPAILCRTAWGLRDGEISEPVESQYGYHFIRRVEFNQKKFMLYNDSAQPDIREAMQRNRQEDLLLGARQRHGVKLFQ